MDVKSRTIFYLTAVFQVSINLGREGKIREGKKRARNEEKWPLVVPLSVALPPVDVSRAREGAAFYINV